MRASSNFSIVLASFLLAFSCSAQDYANCAVQPACGVCGREKCGCDSRICPPQPTPTQQAPPPQPQGVFVAPPQNGTVVGPSNGVHVQGMEIELPSLRLRMPNIRFPSVFNSRTNARMLIDSAEAPFVQPGAMPAMAMPVATAQAPQPNLSTQQLQDILKQLESQQPPQQQQTPQPQRFPHCDRPAPCDAAMIQRIRDLDSTELQLRQRIGQLEEKLYLLERATILSEQLQKQQMAAASTSDSLGPAYSNTQRLPPLERADYGNEVQSTNYERPVTQRLPEVKPNREPRRLPTAE